MKKLLLAAALLLSGTAVQAETIYLNCTVTSELVEAIINPPPKNPKPMKPQPPSPLEDLAAWEAWPEKEVWQVKVSEESEKGTLTDPGTKKIHKVSVFFTPDEIALKYKKKTEFENDLLEANISRINGYIDLDKVNSFSVMGTGITMAVNYEGFCKKAEPVNRAF